MERIYLIGNGDGELMGAYRSYKNALDAAKEEVLCTAGISNWSESEFNHEIDLLYENGYSDDLVYIREVYILD